MKVELKVLGGSRSGQVIPITIPQFMIGRAEDCHLKPRSELISRYHCAILTESAYVAVRDLGSKNGVYVNGERIGVEQELKNGDRLAIGPLEFEVVVLATPKAERKPKVESISDVVARTVEQNSINVATAQQAAQPVAPQPTVAPQPAAPQPEVVAQPAAPQPEVVAQPAAPQPEVVVPKPAPPQPAPVAAVQSSGEEEELADWLLGDDEGMSDETQTLQSSLDDLDLPYTPQEPKIEQEEQKAQQKPSGPSSSDAAANLLKNFFKGGR
ncbi:MAG: FHA domain-containing protein [Thermoguttaceae bacterium]|nr:FHA domain-containing protein [Thermoguttaceae bacterium]MBQ9812963.1 FHA domain-containing protein [Thermoguttaceae bacterium]